MRRRPFRAFTVRLDIDLAETLAAAQAKQRERHSEDAFEAPRVNWSDVVRRALWNEAYRILGE